MKSPLSEPMSSSMDELMSRDPRSLTRADRDAFVAYLLGLRDQWAKDEAAGKRSAKGPRPKTDYDISPSSIIKI